MTVKSPMTLYFIFLCMEQHCSFPQMIGCFHVTLYGGARDQTSGAGVQVEWRFSTLLMHMQNALETWRLKDLPCEYVWYCYLLHAMCERQVHWLHSSWLLHTTTYLPVHHDSHHTQKYAEMPWIHAKAMTKCYRGEVASSQEESLGWRLERRVTGNRMMSYEYLYFASFMFLQCLPSVNSAPPWCS